jgi:5'-nucleotidase
MEAVIYGVPGLAISVDGSEENPVSDYGPAARTACKVAEMVMAHGGLPANVLLNVNVPALPEDAIRGWSITRQGTRIYRDQLLKRADPRGRPYYWIGGQAPTGLTAAGTDIGDLAAGLVSITPVSLDLTAAGLIDEMSGWIK